MDVARTIENPNTMETTAIKAPSRSELHEKEMKALEPLMFLVGDWHGEGEGPWGPYDFATHVEVKGRWVLLTTTVLEPQTDTASYVSTQVYGYDDKGLVLHLFDTAGAFLFHGKADGEGLRFEWKGGDDWKRSDFQPKEGGKIHFLYHAMEPSLPGTGAKFEGDWLPGKRTK
jgi:hypothetical protein